MTERNEELNDKEHLANKEDEAIENDANEHGIEEQGVIADDTASAELANSSVPPSAPERNTAALIAPWIITAIAVIALVFMLVRNTSGGGLDKVVGKMDGLTIKTSDLYAEMTNQMTKDQLTSLVDNVAQIKLIDLEAGKAGITVTDADITNEIENIKKSNNIATDEDLTAALQQSGLTLAEFKEKLIPQVKLKKLYESQNPVSETDLKAYYDKNKENFATTPKEVKASHILLQTKAEADAVLAELKAGKDFATLAKAKSQDPGSKAKGGDLGFFPRGVMNTEFETAAFGLAKGEMSGVVQSPNGFHIIKVTDIKEAVVPAYDVVKEKVKEAYYNEKLQSDSQTWLDKLKKDKNYKNLLAANPAASASASPAESPAASPSASPATK
jgi:foldase protein PrsA